MDDRGLYAQGQLWLTKKDVVGRARGFLPYVGMVTIYMNEYPKFKVSQRIRMNNLETNKYCHFRNYIVHILGAIQNLGMNQK